MTRNYIKEMCDAKNSVMRRLNTVPQESNVNFVEVKHIVRIHSTACAVTDELPSLPMAEPEDLQMESVPEKVKEKP